jgi:hypothetical protein
MRRNNVENSLSSPQTADEARKKGHTVLESSPSDGRVSSAAHSLTRWATNPPSKFERPAED